MRLPLAALCLSVACPLLGCDAGTVVAPGYGSAGGGGGGGTGADAIDFETEIQPLLVDRCADCHQNPSIAPAFLAGADMYETVIGWPDLVVPGEPGESLILTKGAHRGPAWEAAEARLIGDWIVQEGGGAVGGDGGMPLPGDDGGAGTVDGPYTSPMTIGEGRNEIDLSETGVPGAVLVFYATRVAVGLHLSDIAITAGSGGAQVTHPLLVSWIDGRPVADPDDPFSGVELTIPSGGTVSLATSLILVDFPDPGALSVQFDSATTLE